MTLHARSKRPGSAPEKNAPAPEPGRKLPLTVSRPELLPDGTDRDFRRLVHGLFGFLARHEKIRAGHARAIGLAGIEYTVLIAIAHLDGDVNVKTVAEHLHVSGAFVTSISRRLLDLGLIHKTPDPQDRRRVTLTVSEQGYALLERLAPMQRQVNDAEFACLDREEFLALADLVDRLIACSDQAVALQTYLQSKKV